MLERKYRKSDKSIDLKKQNERIFFLQQVCNSLESENTLQTERHRNVKKFLPEKRREDKKT
jgi:hypothetical protein